MELRKLITFGKGSYIISLPKSWVNKNNMKKGDLVSIAENKNELILSTQVDAEKKEETSIVIDAGGKSMGRVKTEIVSAYMNNYDAIEILLKDRRANASELKDTMMNLAGLEVMEQTATRIVAKDLMDFKEVSIPAIIRRMDVIVRNMIEDSILSLEDKSHCESIRQRDQDVNRLHFMALRVIGKSIKDPAIARLLHTDCWTLHNDKLVILRLEKIGDEQKRIAKNLTYAAIAKKAAQELKNIHALLKQRYIDVMKAHYTKDKELAYAVENSSQQFMDKCNDFLKKNHAVPCALIVENLKSTATLIKQMGRDVLTHS